MIAQAVTQAGSTDPAADREGSDGHDQVRGLLRDLQLGDGQRNGFPGADVVMDVAGTFKEGSFQAAPMKYAPVGADTQDLGAGGMLTVIVYGLGDRRGLCRDRAGLQRDVLDLEGAERHDRACPHAGRRVRRLFHRPAQAAACWSGWSARSASARCSTG
ncbi:MAG: hypothetical protein WDO24_00215 [Pseudomonadota bacterium]